MKRRKIVLGLSLVMALALSVVVAMPVYAQGQITLTKEVTPTQPNTYNLTDTIHYVMAIINNTGDNISVEAVWDVLPDGSTVYPTGPGLPYTLNPGQSQGYTYDWVATRTGRNGTVINRFYARGYQISTFNDTFSLNVTKSSQVIGREVGGKASTVNKLGLVAPWALLVGCAAVVTLLVLRRRRQA